MSTKTAVVYTCAHSDPAVGNKRFDWLGSFLYDLKPDLVFDLGDFYDMKSLNSYDTRYPQQIVTQSYERDIDHGLDAQERIRHKFKLMKRKRPFFVGLEGNHEHRISKAISLDPRLEGEKRGISFSHLETNSLYDEYHRYENGAPAIADYEGVSFAHYFAAGNYGNAMSGTHHAYSLLQNRNYSSICGHSHKRSIYFKDQAHPKTIIGLVAGCYKGADEGWAGQANRDWAKGVFILHSLNQGVFDPEWVSMERIERLYAK